jgi:uncharacterized protein (TIGR03000 family)
MIALAMAAAVFVSIGSAPRATAQYAVRGGPIYGGPSYAAYGPSINVGAYAPAYYPNPPYGPAGAGFGSAYISAVPYGYSIGVPFVPATTPRNLVMPSTLPIENISDNPQPPAPPPPPPGTPPGPAMPPPGSIGPSPSTPAVPPALAPPGATDATKPAAPPPTDTSKPATAPPTSEITKPLTPSPTDTTKTAKPAVAAKRTQFTVRLPADAKLWVNDAETKQSGVSRRFHTPTELEPGRAYEYTFRAQWLEGGQTVTRDRTLRFKAGEDLAVDFTQAAAR